MQFNKIFPFIFRSIHTVTQAAYFQECSHSHTRCLLAPSICPHVSAGLLRVGLGLPVWVDWLKIYTLIWRERLSVAEWFGLGQKRVNLYNWQIMIWLRKTETYATQSGPMPPHCTPVICMFFPQTPLLLTLFFSALFPLHRFSWNLILGTFMKICWESPNVVKIRQKYWAIYIKDTHKFHIGGSNIRSATKRMHCCVSVAMLSISTALLTAAYIHQQHTGNKLLCFCGKNAYTNMPQCVICTMPTLSFMAIYSQQYLAEPPGNQTHRSSDHNIYTASHWGPRVWRWVCDYPKMVWVGKLLCSLEKSLPGKLHQSSETLYLKFLVLWHSEIHKNINYFKAVHSIDF